LRRLALAALIALAVGTAPGAQGVAYLAIDLRTHATIASTDAARLGKPVAPGSVIKIATLAAALEAGVVDDNTGITCTREVVVDGHRLVCTHPDLHRPMKPAEALAQSCNVYFATIAKRLPRPVFDRILAGLGLPLSDRGVPMPAVALGIDGIRVAPIALLDAVARVAEDPTRLPWKPLTLTVVREGLQAAAKNGTAAALSARGVEALAKTGTTLSGGTSQGLVVGVTPAVHPTTGFVLLASGAAGLDAAALAAERLRPTKRSAPPVPTPFPTKSVDKQVKPADKPIDKPVDKPTVKPIEPTIGPAPPRASMRPIETKTLRVGVARQGGGYDVKAMSLDEYVAGVIAGEQARDSSPAALQALAITIRTFALANPGRHRADGFDMCDLTHCQVLRKATSATTAAAMATSGQILLYRGAPASVFYTASCGGMTEKPSSVWPGADDPSFLPVREDDACEGQPVWSTELSADDLTRALHSGGFRGELRDVRILGRNDSGRAARLHLEGFTPDQISAQDLRTIVGRTLGWQFIKSTAFDLHRTSSGFRFSGHGSGHGVGLCVIGSAKLGARGKSATEILAKYFPGLEITGSTAPNITTTAAAAAVPASDPSVIVSLPAGDEGERDVIRDLVIASRDRLSRELGVPAPKQLALRFHPTVESYTRATGQTWFTAGATVNGEMHFVPLTVLRERGTLERTVRHEIIHVLTEPMLAGRPLWVREGVASFYSGERGTDAKGSCPSDDELRRPVSPGALAMAYSRATTCFARQIESGKKWSDVK